MTKLKFALKSLYSNQVILDERKKSPWWLAIIFFILAMVCTSIPTLVTGLRTNGSSLITIGNNTLESGLQLFSLENPAMNINENCELVYDNTKVIPSSTDSDYATQMKVVNDGTEKLMNFTSTYVNTEDSSKTQVITLLNVYYFPELDPVNNSNDYKTFTDIIDTKILKKDAKDTSKYELVPVTSIIFTKTSFRVIIFKAIDATVETKYSSIMEGQFTLLKGTNLATVSDINNSNNAESIKTFWCEFLDKGYQPLKVSQTWLSTSILTGISAVATLFVGLLIFIVTRGKNNLYNDMSFAQSLKACAFLALSPAVITLILGFIMPSFASMAYILTFGMRTIFFVMRTSGGVSGSNNQEKPVYQARS